MGDNGQITETTVVSIEWSNTAAVSLTTTTIETNTYRTEGYIYIPYPYSVFDPISVLASFLIFLAVGTAMHKPTSFIIAWFALVVLGIFSHGSAYIAYTIILLMSAFFVYRFLKKTKEVK